MTRHEELERERELVALAQTLPREVAPPADAWEGIRARLGADRLTADAGGVRPAGFWYRPIPLLAAAGLLVAVSSAVTAVVVRSGVERPAAVAAAGSAPTALAEFAAKENDYLQMVNSLVAAVEDESTGLTPETIAIVRANLLVIDAAILDARKALAEDPANRNLVDILASTYEKKLDLLRRTTAMGRSS